MARRELAALVVAFVVLVVPSRARAEDEIDAPTLRAEKLAADAEAKVAAGAYERAIELYTSAYEEHAAAVLLFDMAWIYDRHLNSRMEAIELYRRATAAGDLEPRLVKLANERLTELEGARSRPEDHPLPTTPSEKRSGGGWSALKIGGVATAGVGIAGIGTSLVLGALAISKDDEAAQLCNGDRCSDARALSLTDDATGLATAANVTFISGAVLLAGGIVMWLVAK